MAELIQEKPEALALIICDQLITDERTKKKTLVGIFNNLRVNSLPATHPEMIVFVSVRGGQGRYEAELKLCHQATDSPAIKVGGEIQFRDPFHVIEVAYRLRGVPFSLQGAHCFEFYCNGELILSRPFNVDLIPSKP